MRALRLGLALAALSFPAAAQSPFPAGPYNQSGVALISPTPPVTDNSDRIATTAWVNNFFALGIPLASGKIFIGSAGGLATAQTMSGDCTLIASGVITCTQSAGNFLVNGTLTVSGAVIDGSGILATNIAAPVTPAAGTTRIYVDSSTKVLTFKNDAGTLGNAVVPSTCSASQWARQISSGGVITCSQPALTDISGFGTNVAAWLATPTSANLRAALTDETGTGAAVFGTSPAITTPTGIVKGDVGLGNVANVDTTNAANISSGNLSVSRLNGGTSASGSTYWRGDGVWASPVLSLNGLAGAVTTNTVVQTFCPSGCTTTVAAGSSATYTPTSGMLHATIECLGTGGGGGGVTGSTGAAIWAGGGGSGSYSRSYVTAAAVGASKTVTIGTAGTGGAAGNNAGTAGGDTSVGTLCVGKGGSGGGFANITTVSSGGVGGVQGTGDFKTAGNGGQGGFNNGTGTAISMPSGAGAPSVFGGAPVANGSGCPTVAVAGPAATSYGAGGGGACAVASAATAAGGPASPGIVIITERINF